MSSPPTNKSGEHVEIEYAYHVTDLLGDSNEEYKKLQLSMADNKTYCKALVRFSCVFFSVTKNSFPGCEHGLPDISPYPRNQEAGKRYKRILVPINQFDEFPYIYEVNSSSYAGLQERQKHYSLLKSEEKIALEKLPFFSLHFTESKDTNALKRGKNNNSGKYVWYANDRWLDGKATQFQYFVNIAILTEWPLHDVVWDTVTRYDHPTGEVVSKNAESYIKLPLFLVLRMIEDGAIEKKKDTSFKRGHKIIPPVLDDTNIGLDIGSLNLSA